MKKVVKFFGLTAVSLFAVVSASAQPGSVTGTKYGRGQDSLDCIRDLSLYQQDNRHKNYDAAIVNWRKVWKNCPNSSINLAAHGIGMYQFFIARELDQNKKKALVDTLMTVYERGMELRPQNKGNYLAGMAQDIIKYADTPENQPKLLKILEETMVTEKEKTTALTYANYMKIILAQNAAGKLSDEELLDDYTKVSDYISAAIKKTSNEELAKARDMIDESFAGSSAASCDNLLKIYGAKYEASKEDPEFLRKLTRMLNRKECTDSELFEKASEQQYTLNPSPDAAYNMAKLFFKKENFDKAVEYFENAIKSETDPIEKANYNYQLGGILLTKYNKYGDAKKYAIEASKLRPDWGAPYILLANTYANGPKCGEDDFEKAQIYWVVVDKLQKAKAVDSDMASVVNPLISQYAQHFPKKEEAFFRNITEGAAVSIGCWVSESTKARFNN
ncbi:MAG: tetratricopeptide repeat protein [Bacteroidales bacterium]|jgi:tetratricopeptide (TPR) repeat protein|nr:tetratricopeptide repeat protein [Bacteroidales bacterium]